MKKVLSYMTIISVIVILFIIGILIPKYFISNGLENFEGEEKEFAKYAIQNVNAHNEGPFFITSLLFKIKVSNVKKISDEPCDMYDLNHQYVARVCQITLFGIPYNCYDIYCNGGSTVWSLIEIYLLIIIIVFIFSIGYLSYFVIKKIKKYFVTS